jgi:phospholipase/carboxylesterase
VLLLLVGCLAGCGRAPEHDAPRVAASAPAPLAPASAAPSVTATLPLTFAETTTGHVAPGAPAPLVVALHGLGDRPESFLGLFDGFAKDARIVAPHSAIAYSDGFAWFPPGNGTSDLGAPALEESATQVATFIDAIAKARPTLGKPIVVGFSQGGALAFTLATRHGASIGAAIPMGGWLPHALWPSATPAESPPPIVALHGAADTRVPFDGTQATIEHLQKLRYPATLRSFDGVGHAIPPAVHEALFQALALACDAERERAASAAAGH